jgi:hypothetical protein
MLCLKDYQIEDIDRIVDRYVRCRVYRIGSLAVERACRNREAAARFCEDIAKVLRTVITHSPEETAPKPEAEAANQKPQAGG